MNNAGALPFRVPNTTGVMDLLAGDAEVSNSRRIIVPLWNNGFPIAADRLDLAALLGGIIFVGKAALGFGLYFECMALCAISSGNQIIVGTFGRRQSCSSLRCIISKCRLIAGVQDFC